MGRTEAPGTRTRRLLLTALLAVGAAPARTAPAGFSLRNGMATMASFRDGTFTMRARPEFQRPDGYLALAFGSPRTPRKYYVILTATGIKLWRLRDGGERRLLDTARLELTGGQEITLRFAIKGRRYFAEVAGYPPLIADDEESFKGLLVLRVAGAKVDYNDPVVEVESL